MDHFLLMGGYARYIWPAFGLALVVMVLNIFWARRSLRRAQIDARRRLLTARPAAPQHGSPQRPGAGA